jgi:DNA end-binding protein Ku
MARSPPRSSSRASRKPRRERTTPGARPQWTGQLRLSLVAVPIKVFPAIKSGSKLAFHQIHKPSGQRIRYQKVAPGVGEVDASDIVKGYELGKGNYVLLTDEEIENAKVESRETCELVQFVDYAEVDPLYFDKPYYLTPMDDLAEEPYRVIREALRAKRKMALGQIVMRGREYMVSIKPCGDGLLMETLRYADEIRAAAPYFAEISAEKPDKELVDLAAELIERKAARFDPEHFHDRYSETLRDLIEKKAKTKQPIEVSEAELPQRGAQVIDLVEALKRSVRGAAKDAAPPTKKRAAAAKSKAAPRSRKAA